jgi:hypothetical protein
MSVTGLGVPPLLAVESDTVKDIRTGDEVTWVGTPEITPVNGLRASPGGRLDPAAKEYVYGGFPPFATIAEIYGTPTAPADSCPDAERSTARAFSG